MKRLIIMPRDVDPYAGFENANMEISLSTNGDCHVHLEQSALDVLIDTLLTLRDNIRGLKEAA